MKGPARKSLGAALASVALLGAVPAPQAAQVTVDVANVRNSKGHIRVSVCTQATFLKTSCPFEAKAPSTVGETTVVVPGVPRGAYAIQIFQDEHDDAIVHRNFLGVPTEGIGFSNDAPLHMKGPRFNEASFDVGDQPVELHIRLRHLLP